MRLDGRAADELRPVTFERDFTEMTLGATLVRSSYPSAVHRVGTRRRAALDEGRGTGWVSGR